jgi:endonuclease YncB( thermonuclease family)
VGACVIEGFVWRLPARVQRVYDGDTIYLVDIDQGHLTHRAAASVSNKPERVRVLDLWCPEMRSRDPDEKAHGLAAKAFAETRLPPGTIVVFSSHVWDRTLERTLGRIQLLDGRDYAEVMVAAGHGTRTRP